MQMKYPAAAVLSLVVSTLMGGTPATAAPTPPPVGGEHRLRPGALAPKTGDVRAPGARASLPGWDELLRDGITLLHRSVPVTTKPVTGKGATRADFDGDGRDDIAATSDNGVIVRYSSAPRRDYLRTAAPDGACICSNALIVSGNFNGDRYDDLAVADPYEPDLKDMGYRAGGVWIFSGGPGGLNVSTVKHVTQSTAGIPGSSGEGDWMGSAMAAGDITGDGRDELAIGIPYKKVGKVKNAGAVVVLKGSSTGLQAKGATWLTQNSSGVPDIAELGDRFGGGLTIGKVNKDRYQELIVGSPTEDDTKPRGGTGMVTQFWGSAAGPSLKKVTGVSSATATAAAKQENTWLWYLGGSMGVTDINGDGYGEVVVGAGAAQSGKNGNVGGAVVGFAGRATGLSAKGIRVLSQDSTGIADSTEHDDHFGDSIAVGDVTGDGLGDVLVGVPGEDIGKAIDTGSIVLLRGSRKGLSGAGSQTLTQSSATVPDKSERGDGFGYSLSLLNLNGSGGLDALVSAPDELNVGDTGGSASGIVISLPGGSKGFATGGAAATGHSLRLADESISRYGGWLVATQN